MAAKSFTASEWSSQPRHMPTGVITKTSLFTLSTTSSPSSIFYLCKVPDRATILDFLFWHDDAGGSATANMVTTNDWKLGFVLPEGSASSTTTKSAIAPALAGAFAGILSRPIGNKLPVTLSISTECPQRWAWIIGTFSISCSASAVLKFTVKYTMDGG